MRGDRRSRSRRFELGQAVTVFGLGRGMVLRDSGGDTVHIQSYIATKHGPELLEWDAPRYWLEPCVASLPCTGTHCWCDS